ncbi:PIR protein [Plasmodium ovale]|uniref:PIR protein n=1 Tax=Plasmodium ovale TaxID=36330 RepID=A0A1C3KH57_PLAOA|nr:PIR protein [Plasmodium ovale]
MATIHVVSSSTPDTSRRDKCIGILSDIQSAVTFKIAELHKTKEEDANFIEICEYLGQYLDYYEEDIKACYVDDFSYLYEIIISLLNEEFSKSPQYIKCIQKVTFDIKEHIDPKNKIRDSHTEKGSEKGKIQLEEKVNKILKSAEEPLEIKELEHNVPPETDTKIKTEEERVGRQTNLEQPEYSVPSLQLEMHAGVQPQITAPLDTQRAQKNVTSDESTSHHYESALAPSKESTSTEVTADRDVGQKVPLIRDIGNENPSPPETSPTSVEGRIAKEDPPSQEGTSFVKDASPKDNPFGKSESSHKNGLPGVVDSSDASSLHRSHELVEGKPNNKQIHTGHTYTNTVLTQNANAEQDNKNSDVLIDTKNPGYQNGINREIFTSEISGVSETKILRQDKDSSTTEAEPAISSLKMYVTIGLSIVGFLLLLILLFKFTPLGSRFNKNKKKKRREIQEELERMMYSPSYFNENNMYLSYAHLED